MARQGYRLLTCKKSVSDGEERAIARAVETLIQHGWRWGESELGESPKALVPGFRKIEASDG